MDWRALFRRKPLGEARASRPGRRLRRALTWLDLTGFGLGAIIGSGIFVLTGVVAARYAGPAVVVSLALAGAAAALAALVYAELAAMAPLAGGAYAYAYAALGELPAWLIGWNLVLEYAVAAAAVAVGWAGYLTDLLRGLGVHLAQALTAPPPRGALNLPAAMAALAATAVVASGARESAAVTRTVVVVKLAALLGFLALGIPRVDPRLWTPFFPYGAIGALNGAAVVFFAYIGFDAVATAAEEARRPQRDLPLGILLALAIAALLYVAVALVLTGLVPFRELDTPSPVAEAMLRRGPRWAGALVAAGALAGLSSVLVVNVYGQARIFYAMARDGLLPEALARVHPRTGTPLWGTLATGLIVAGLAAFLPIHSIAELANAGTLTAFAAVAIALWVLRRTEPAWPRPFLVPGMPWTALAAAASSVLLLTRLPRLTWLRYLGWSAVGLAVYFLWARRRAAGAAPAALPLDAGRAAPAGHADEGTGAAEQPALSPRRP